MGVLAGDRHLGPAETLPVGDHADVLALGLEYRALLYMQLEKGVHLPGADLLVAAPADALQLIAELKPFGVLSGIGPVLIVNAGEHAAREHCRSEPGAFLIGPVNRHDRTARPYVQIVQSADDLQSAEHTQNSIELSAGRLGVEMRADVYGQGVGIGSLTPREHGAHPVHAHGAARVLAPLPEHRAARGVRVGQCLAVVTARDTRTDLRHLHDRRPQPIAVDPQVLSRGGHRHALNPPAGAIAMTGPRGAAANRTGPSIPREGTDTPASARLPGNGPGRSSPLITFIVSSPLCRGGGGA